MQSTLGHHVDNYILILLKLCYYFCLLDGNDHDSYDKSKTLKESKCGKKDPFYFTSSKERIWIRFKSDRFTNQRGFVVGYVMYDKSKCCANSLLGLRRVS